MVIDSSVIIAILLGEPGADELADLIARDDERLISSVSCLECGLVLLARKGAAALPAFQALLFRARVEEVGFSPEQSLIAMDAYRKFGKGRHPAALNLGDCCSYALATLRGAPLLFKGDDFSKTDVQDARQPSRS